MLLTYIESISASQVTVFIEDDQYETNQLSKTTIAVKKCNDMARGGSKSIETIQNVIIIGLLNYDIAEIAER